MKIQEFIEYKKLIESDGLIPDDQADKVYAWMEETGRLDEGFFGSVWKWLKRNFSPKARKLHFLSDEYEKELAAEIRAEWDSLEYKTIADKWRKGSYMRLSSDIEDRMDLIAGEDTDYRELAKVLINKKRLKVKRLLLNHFSSKLDPDEYRNEVKELDDKEAKNNRRLTDIENSLIKEDKKGFYNRSVHLKNLMGNDRRFVEKAQITDKEKDSFISMIVLYVKKASKQGDGKFDNDTVAEYAKKYVSAVDEFYRKIESKEIVKKDAIQIVKDVLNEIIQEDKPIPWERVKSNAYKMMPEKAKEFMKKKSGEGKYEEKDDEKDTKTPEVDDLDRGIVTPATTKVSDVDVDQTIKDASKETDNHTPKEVSEEILSSVRAYFKDNASDILNMLAKQVNKFNEKSVQEKEKEQEKYKYNLDKNNKLPVPGMEELNILLNDFVKIAGKIVPYYEYGEKSTKFASMSVAEKIFQIYAIKKDENKQISEDDIDKIVYAIKNA